MSRSFVNKIKTASDNDKASVVAPLAAGGTLIANGLLANKVNNIMKSHGLGERLNRDFINRLDSFSQAADNVPFDEFIYQYANLGHAAANTPVLEHAVNGKNPLAWEAMPKFKRVFSDVVDAVEKPIKPAVNAASFIQNKILPNSKHKIPKWDVLRSWINNYVHDNPENALSSLEHYYEFSKSPLNAFIKAVDEAKFPSEYGASIGNLANEIADAHNNYNNPYNRLGKAFNTPEEYFRDWQIHEHRFNPAGYDKPMFTRLMDITRGKSRDEIMAMFDHGWGKSDGYFGGREGENIFNKGGIGKPPKYKTEMNGNRAVFSKINPDGPETTYNGVKYEYRNLADIHDKRVENPALAYIEAMTGAKFLDAAKKYKAMSRVAKFIDAYRSAPIRLGSHALGSSLVASAILNFIMNGKNKKGMNVGTQNIRLVKKSSDDSEARNAVTFAIPTAGASGIGSYMYARNKGLHNINPFADVNVSVIGGIREYDGVARDMIAKAVEAGISPKDWEKIISTMENGTVAEKATVSDFLKSRNFSLDDIRRMLKAVRSDSFSTQTHAIIDALTHNGVNVNHILRAKHNPSAAGSNIYDMRNHYKPVEITPDAFSKSDAFIQVGMHPQEQALFANRDRTGAPVYRVASDFGEGNFRQPDKWLGTENWMKIMNPEKYDRLIIPGGEDMPANAPHGRKKSLFTSSIATSPIFKHTEFSKTPNKHMRGMFTIGGGSAGFLAFDPPGSKGDVLVDILKAMREKDPNARLDLYVGDVMNNIGRKTKKTVIDEHGRVFENSRPPHNEELAKRIEYIQKVIKNRKLNPALHDAYKGLRIVGLVPQSEIANAYATSDFIFTLPGSTIAEFGALKGDHRGTTINIVPDEPWWAPRHFSTNAAWAEKHIPGAKTVRISDANRAAKIREYVLSGGKIARGKTPNLEPDLKPVVNTIKRDVRLGRIKNLGKLGLIAAPGIAATAYAAKKTHDAARQKTNVSQEPVLAAEKATPKQTVTDRISDVINSHPVAAGAAVAGTIAVPIMINEIRNRIMRKKLNNRNNRNNRNNPRGADSLQDIYE